MTKELIEQIGILANKLIDARSKIETDERIKMVLSTPPHQHSVNTCGQNLDSHLYVKVVNEKGELELAGEQDHYSGVQHEPSFNGRLFGAESLKHLSKELTVVQLSAIYSERKKPLKVIADYREDYGDWESGNTQSWEIEFGFP